MNLRDKESHSYEIKEENETTVSRKRKASNLGGKVTPNSEKASETSGKHYASIIPENIMLVYLRRSSVQELLKDPETFVCNVVGSYVRIQSDPNDHSQKHSHQLLQVAGVNKASGCSDVGEEYILQVIVLALIREVPISMLSDEYFRKEECKDLYQRVIAGSAHRPTVVELQCKAQMLHKVITEQWLAREFSLVKNLMMQYFTDRDNEKGWCTTENKWRSELFENLKRQLLLQKPAEHEETLLTVPNVIAEDLKSGSETVVGTSAASAGVDEEGKTTFVKEANGVLGVTEVDKLDINMGSIIGGKHKSIYMNGSTEIAKNSREPEVIDISDDDNDRQGDNPDSALWYYEDFEQVTRGPFQASRLKGWKENNYFPQGFKVWKHGQAPVLLDDMISQMFPN